MPFQKPSTIKLGTAIEVSMLAKLWLPGHSQAHVYWMNKCMNKTTGPGSYVQNVSTPGVASGALDPGLSRAHCSTASPQISKGVFQV